MRDVCGAVRDAAGAGVVWCAVWGGAVWCGRREAGVWCGAGAGRTESMERFTNNIQVLCHLNLISFLI